MHTSPCLMWFTIQSLQRDLGERIDKLDSSSWGIRVECLSRCRWKLGKHLIEKNINIASRIVRHAWSQHYHILTSSFCILIIFYFPVIFFLFALLQVSHLQFSISSTSSNCLKIRFASLKYNQSPCGLDTWTSESFTT